ncbi:MAG: hypothetical protein JJT95_18730 [Pararhodobacter sp.]|nr:hypothetical protein [Pararhodobacter sp.]
MGPDDSGPANPPPPPELRFLKLLVTLLTGVMIVGLVTIVALLVIRLAPAPAPTLPALPENIALPDGVQMQALTIARDWVVVVSDEGEVLLYDRRSGQLRQRVGVE